MGHGSDIPNNLNELVVLIIIKLHKNRFFTMFKNKYICLIRIILCITLQENVEIIALKVPYNENEVIVNSNLKYAFQSAFPCFITLLLKKLKYIISVKNL